MSASDFEHIARVLREATGIVLGPGKAPLAYSRLAKRLRQLGLESFKEYCALIGSPSGADELQAMLAALTTNVTRFFREPHHFDLLRAEASGVLASKGGAREPVRLWSAACSSGQEPYSMAISLLQGFPEAVRADVRILATDIDPNILAEARAGRYQAEALESVPDLVRRRFFSRDGDGAYSVDPALKALIRFNALNLIGAWPMRRSFDVIFCRNVVIYFDEDTQAELWTRFAAALNPGGLLCIGHSERIHGPAERQFAPCGLTSYRRVGS